MESSKTHKIQDLSLITSILSQWYESNGRTFPWREVNATPYQKVLTEILVQRTRAETVAKIYSEFFHNFPNWHSLDTASLESIQETIKPLGIWRRRALTLKNLSRDMVLLHGVFPSTRNEINKLTGVGQYVGNAIEMFVHQRAMPLIDTNMARVVERVFRPRDLADIRYDPWLQKVCTQVVQADNPAEINWAILDLGGTICMPKNPQCGKCPLSDHCNYFKQRI